MPDYRNRRSAIASAVMLALASAAAAAQDDVATLSEITVTAQKRTESLQDVPIAVSAVSGTKIADAGIMKIEDLKNYVPTLFMTETAIGNNISIRGIFSGVNPGFEQSVGTYVDGIYRGRPQQTRAPFLDLERVEVLRGPQSILFGKNSVGGALNITTARPTGEFDAMLSALYEPRYEEQEFTAHVSGPFTDRLRGRLAARYREVDGAIHNATLGTEDPSHEETTVRAWLEMDVSDNVTASLKAEHGEFDVIGRQIEIDQETASVSPNPAFAGLTYAEILRLRFGQDVSVLDATSNYVRSSNGDFSNNDTDEFVLQVDWQVGENTVTSVTGYSEYSFDELCDCDFTGANVFNVLMDEEYEQTSQEIRVTSPTGGKLEYIVGAYYETSDLEFRDSIQLPSNSVLVPVLNGNPAFCLPGSVPPFVPQPPFAPLCGIAGSAVANTGSPRVFTQSADSYSAFAQITVNISEEFRSTFGLRYTNDKKDALRSLAITDINGGALVGVQAFAPAVYGAAFNVRGHNLSGNRSEEQLLPSVTVEWKPDDSTMLYASWKQGAKSGGYDARSNNPTSAPPGGCTANRLPPGCVGSFEFQEEKSDNLELGAKLNLGGTFEMNAAFFWTDFKDLQVSTFDGVLGFNVKNAGEAQIRGLEIDARWQATQNLMLSSSIAYTDFEFQDYIGQCFPGQPANAPDGLNCDYSGKTNEFVAPWVGTLAANYTHPVGSSMMFHLGLDVYYTDKYFVAPTLDPKQTQAAYYKLNGRMGVSDADGSWDVSLIGKNLLNEQILPYGNVTPLAGSIFGAFSAWRFVEPGSSLALQGTVRF